MFMTKYLLGICLAWIEILKKNMIKIFASLSEVNYPRIF